MLLFVTFAIFPPFFPLWKGQVFFFLPTDILWLVGFSLEKFWRLFFPFADFTRRDPTKTMKGFFLTPMRSQVKVPGTSCDVYILLIKRG